MLGFEVFALLQQRTLAGTKSSQVGLETGFLSIEGVAVLDFEVSALLEQRGLTGTKSIQVGLETGFLSIEGVGVVDLEVFALLQQRALAGTKSSQVGLCGLESLADLLQVSGQPGRRLFVGRLNPSIRSLHALMGGLHVVE